MNSDRKLVILTANVALLSALCVVPTYCMSMNHIYEQDNTHRLSIKCDKYVKPRGKQKSLVHCQVSSKQQPCRDDPQWVRKTGGEINKFVNIKRGGWSFTPGLLFRSSWAVDEAMTAMRGRWGPGEGRGRDHGDATLSIGSPETEHR